MRYYYDDPIKAAWQLHHHGVKCTVYGSIAGDGTYKESTQPIPLWALGRAIENKQFNEYRFYIWPGVDALLLPRAGDLVELRLKDKPIIYHKVESLHDATGLGQSRIWTIIQRDNKVWFAPKVGE